MRVARQGILRHWQTNTLKGRFSDPPGFPARYLLMQQYTFSDLISNRMNRIKCSHGFLKNHTNVTATKFAQRRFIKLGQVPAVEMYGSSTLGALGQ